MKKLFGFDIEDEYFDFLFCEQTKGKEIAVENGKVVARDRVVTQEEINTQKIAELKQNLLNTDYQAIKYAEGELTEEEYAPIKAQRKEWRTEINRLEEELKNGN